MTAHIISILPVSRPLKAWTRETALDGANTIGRVIEMIIYRDIYICGILYKIRQWLIRAAMKSLDMNYNLIKATAHLYWEAGELAMKYLL